RRSRSQDRHRQGHGFRSGRQAKGCSMTATDHTESRERQRTMLRSAMGPRIAAALADPAVIEVMVNPDGALRVDRLGEGRIDLGARIAPAATERIIRLVASHLRLEVHANSPIVS